MTASRGCGEDIVDGSVSEAVAGWSLAAYTSDESGRTEALVQSFPETGGWTQISTSGGTEPVWSRDGRELFYLNGDAMMAVEIRTSPTFTAGAPRMLFEGRYVRQSKQRGQQ